MGTTLTGTTPQDTYDSLIKVTNNGPLSSTARYLSDGLGNDSVLALSTAQVGIGTSTTSARLGVDNALNVGVQSLSSDPSAASVFLSNTGTSVGLAIATTNANVSYLQGRQKTGTGNAFDIALNPLGGNVGIGTSSPTSALEMGSGLDIKVSTTGNLILGSSSQAIYKSSGADAISFNANAAERFRITANGVTFNGDTAAANALSDYEQGTFTATITGGTFSSLNTGVYTKIGRMVYWYLNPTTTAITGNLQISGLPFTNADRSASIFATIPPSGVTYLPAFHNTSSASCDISVSGTYSGGAVSTYFAGVYSV